MFRNKNTLVNKTEFVSKAESTKLSSKFIKHTFQKIIIKIFKRLKYLIKIRRQTMKTFFVIKYLAQYIVISLTKSLQSKIISVLKFKFFVLFK